MRQIKFRGKSLFANHKWLYGSLLILNGKYYICPLEADAWNMTKHQVIPETVGQFTGLKDKNGVDIYEGDILAFEREKSFKIEHIHPFVMEWTDYNNGMNGWTQFSPKNLIKVIGNIYDNKELLEEVK